MSSFIIQHQLEQDIAAGNWLLENPLWQQTNDILDNMRAQVKFEIIPPREDTSAYEIYEKIGAGGIIPMTVELDIKSKTSLNMGWFYDWYNKQFTSDDERRAYISSELYNPPYSYYAPKSEPTTANGNDPIGLVILNSG